MEPNISQMLLLFSFFTLIIFNLRAGCAKHTSITLAPNSPPNLQFASSPRSRLSPESISAAASSPRSQLIHPSANAAQETSSTVNPSSETRRLKESLRNDVLYQSIPHYHRPLPLIARNPRIKKICDSTDYPALCLTFIAPFFNGKCDPISVLEMALKASSQQIKIAIAASTKLAHKMPSAGASNLKHCKDNYHDALDNLQNAMDAIPTRDIGTINSMLSAAVTDFSECDDAFAVHVSYVTDYDGHFTKMVSNCLAIASLVK